MTKTLGTRTFTLIRGTSQFRSAQQQTCADKKTARRKAGRPSSFSIVIASGGNNGDGAPPMKKPLG
jgi:hypothetical protein